MTQGYDVIDDVHGQARRLERLRRTLGYDKCDGVYGRLGRTAVFVGGLIDRGPLPGRNP